MEDIKLPKILSNIPEGKDLFKAESHKKIANSIISIIENQSNSIEKQIIGLEGDWGTGKSNIIKIIEDEISKKKKLKDKYLHYTFDTWTHQEDLTRKSIIIELINSLRNNIDSFNSENWIDKEAQLSQKRISKNTKHFPQVKLYYIFLIIGFIIIKFVNETKKQLINGKLYGYFDNSLSYLIDEFHINYSESLSCTYFLKFTPYFFFILSIILFIKSFHKDFKENNKEKSDKKKLTFSQLIGKSFYWVSGEKLESNSDETITEIEPSNLRFRNFLHDIDTELIANEKTLVLTIDNTDRLTSEKLKSIWSTINIFFAENNNSIFLKNIWLIIPYDSAKVIDSFKEEKNIGIGLLEKTFALTFKVPPPLISNWELFFKLCFNKSFDETDINEKENEIEILLRVYENYEKEITPRRIINFINQLATYYIQNPSIELRYFSIVILKKDSLFDGIINENIINRSMYLEKLETFFTEDVNLELNLAKVIYGVDKDIDAQESLLHNVIEERLKNFKEFDNDVLSLPYFYTYFHKYFKKFIDSGGMERLTNDKYFDDVTNILNHLEPFFIQENKKRMFEDLWEYYYNKIKKNRFTIFNQTVIGVCKSCSKKSKIELINKSLVNIIGDNSKEVNGFQKENQILYINFLKDVNSFITQNKNFNFNDLTINEQEIDAELIINLIYENRELYKKINVKLSINELITFLTDNPYDKNLSSSKLIQYKNELLFLSKIENLNFIEKDINTYWIINHFNNIDIIDTLIFYHSTFRNITIDKISNITFSSIVKLILNSDENIDLTNAFLLIFINYNKVNNNYIASEFKKVLDRFDGITYQNMTKNIKQYSTYEKLYKVLDLCIQYDKNENIKDFALNLIKVNSFKLNNESFNWILENYTILNSRILNINDFNLYDYLNKNAKNHEIIIENIDIELFNKSSKFLNTELIEKANNYLLNNVKSNRAFLQNRTTREYKLFEKLLDLDKIKRGFFEDNFINSFSDLVIKNNLPIQISNQQIIKIKSFIDTIKLKSILEINLNRIAVSKNVYILSPEIFLFFDKIQSQNKDRILHSIVKNIDFYNEQFFNQVMISQNVGLISALRNNLLNHPNNQIKELAIKKGIIELDSK
jgi:hypothetical protein